MSEYKVVAAVIMGLLPLDLFGLLAVEMCDQILIFNYTALNLGACFLLAFLNTLENQAGLHERFTNVCEPSERIWAN